MNRNRRDLNINTPALAAIHHEEDRMRRARAEYIGRNMFDFDVGDDVEANMDRPNMDNYFRGTVVNVDYDTGMVRVVPDLDKPYIFKVIARYSVKPVIPLF